MESFKRVLRGGETSLKLTGWVKMWFDGWKEFDGQPFDGDEG